MSLPTPLIDLDANSITGSNGAAVATFPDVSGNSRSLTQATSADQPVLLVNALNGRKAVQFTGDYMTNASTGITGETAFTACFVMTVNAIPAGARYGVLSGATTGDDWNQTGGNFAFSNPMSTAETSFTSLTASGSLTSANDVQVLFSARDFGTYAIIVIVAGVDGSVLQTYVNGVPESPLTGRSGTAVSLGGLTLGARYYGGVDPVERAKFSIARLRIYSGRLTSSQLGELNNEMAVLFFTGPSDPLRVPVRLTQCY